MSGLAKIMPAWAVFFCVFAFASVGLPGLNGFVGEFLTMIGTFNSREVNGSPLLGPWFAIPAALGVILAAIYLLYLVGKVVFGPLNLPHWEDTGETGIAGGHDLSYREAMTLTPLAIVCLLIGLFPYPILRSLEPAIQEHTQYVHHEIDKMEAEDADRFEDGSDLNAKTPSRQDAKEELAGQSAWSINGVKLNVDADQEISGLDTESLIDDVAAHHVSGRATDAAEALKLVNTNTKDQTEESR